MFCSGVWATEVEIMAVAHMLETDVYTFNGRWYIFSGKVAEIGSVTSDEAIYLNHTNSIHYNVVLSVHILPMETNPNDLIISDGISKDGEETEVIQNIDVDSLTTDDNIKINECIRCYEQIKDDSERSKNAKGKKPKRKMSAAMRRKKDRDNKRVKYNEYKKKKETVIHKYSSSIDDNKMQSGNTLHKMRYRCNVDLKLEKIAAEKNQV